MPIIILFAAVAAAITTFAPDSPVAGALNAVFGFVKDVALGFTGAVVSTVIGLLPDAADLGITIPSGWINGYDWLDSFLPLHEALAFVAIFLALIAAVGAFRLAVLIYHLIPKPFSGT